MSHPLLRPMLLPLLSWLPASLPALLRGHAPNASAAGGLDLQHAFEVAEPGGQGASSSVVDPRAAEEGPWVFEVHHPS